jgi:hypothetical protein
MDFMQRDNRSHQQSAAQTASVSTAPTASAGRPKQINKFKGLGILSLFSLVLLVAVAGVVIGVSVLFVTTPNHVEQKFVDKTKLQAVFLNGGQVYFGNVLEVNNKFMRVGGIYYLRVNQQVQPGQTNASTSDVSLVKLGCELHGPSDAMVINREQIIFWENLKADGQVAKAVTEFNKQNPNGQKCEAPTTATPPAAAPAATPAATTTKKS